jgi:hypothetical protein
MTIMMSYWVKSLDGDFEEFCMFWTKASRDNWLSRYSDERWEFGRLIDGVEITEGRV